MAMTRLSTAAVAQVVQPRFDAPETTKLATLCAPPPRWTPRTAVMASIARTALLVIGSRAGQFSSPVRRYLSQV